MERQGEVIPGSDVPFAFDAAFYVGKYPELQGIDDNAVAGHFLFAGIAEGRQGHPRGNRPAFIEYISAFSSVLEVGPFCNPAVRGANVQYLDVLDEKQLRARAESLGIDASGCPERIHHIGDIFDINETFDAVVSSHCIEHQPDLIHHLQGVARVLRPGGRYLLAVPDKRYCFDHFIPESTLADVLQAHSERRIIHTLRSVIEHQALTTHNNPHAHWAGDHGEQFPAGQADRVNDAIRIFNTSGVYIDVHSWTFTPSSFYYIINNLYKMGRIRLKPIEIYTTPHNELEFFVVLDVQEEAGAIEDDFALSRRDGGENIQIRDAIIADLRSRLDRADAERRDAQAKLLSLLPERLPARRASLLLRRLGLSRSKA